MSPVPARMGALVMTLDKVMSAHVQKDFVERTARVWHLKYLTLLKALKLKMLPGNNYFSFSRPYFSNKKLL